MNLLFKKILAAFITVCAVFIFGTTILHTTLYATSNETDTTPSVSTSSVSREYVAHVEGAPIRIRIPAINVDAHVQHVGIAKSGNMAVPTNFTDVAWFREGAVPGEMGSAVIDGHVDNGLGIPAVFSRLNELKAGDDIYIDTIEGATLHFIVEDAQTYSVDEVPRQRLFNRSDAPRLNLITCDGTWIKDQKMYDERHVVYAVLAQSM